MATTAQPEGIFVELINIITEQSRIIKSITEKLEELEVGKGNGGGGGSASIEDYESGKPYKRNTLLVDTDTETVYRVCIQEGQPYISNTVETDCAMGYLKLVGFESQVVTIGHNPSQAEIDAMPDNALVAVYSATDAPYMPNDSGY